MSKRGRKPSKVDVRVKLERSRQSARECRARKKLRYQYLEELVSSRERAIHTLRSELEDCKKFARELDSNNVSDGLKRWLKQDNIKIESSRKPSSSTTDASQSSVKMEAEIKQEVDEVSEPTVHSPSSAGGLVQQVPDVEVLPSDA